MPEGFRFQETLDALKRELQQDIQLRDELDKKIAGAKQSIRGLLQLRDASIEDAEPAPGAIMSLGLGVDNIAAEITAQFLGVAPPTEKLTDLCRSVIRSSGRAVTAPEIRHEVELMGFDFSDYSSNPLSSIHTIMGRMSGVEKRKEGSQTVYEWKIRPAGLTPPNPVTPPRGLLGARVARQQFMEGPNVKK